MTIEIHIIVIFVFLADDNDDFVYVFSSQIFIAPSGVQKERMKAEDMFVQTIDDVDLELPPPEKM